MSKGKSYILDADSFIRAKRQHYGFDSCPGYWDALLRSFRNERFCSIQPVRKELERGKDDLKTWVIKTAPEEFFASVEDEGVEIAYAKVIRNVQSNPQFTPAAKQKFASGADPWLIAYASVFRCVVSTYEVSAPESKAKIKLPDVAEKFNVECILPFEMLRDLEIVLRLGKSAK